MAIGKTNAFSGNGGFQVGYINSAGNIQPLSFSGTTASDDGEPLTGLTKKIFNTGKPEPAYSGGGGGISNLYKITSVSGTTYSGVKATAYDSSTDTFTFASTAETLTASSAPTVDYLYAAIENAIIGDAIKFVGDIPLNSAPNGVMTSNTTTSDGSDWTVSGENAYGASENFCEFNGVTGSGDYRGAVQMWNTLIWHSDTPRLLKRLKVYYISTSSYTRTVYGSNDGGTWQVIGTYTQAQSSGWETYTFPSNSSLYTYHKILNDGNSGQIEIEAYSTLS